MTSYPEPMVARATGVAKRVLAATRQARLTKGVDWALSSKAVVEYTPEGLEKICAALRLDAALVRAMPAEAAPQAQFACRPPVVPERAAGGDACGIEASAGGGGAVEAEIPRAAVVVAEVVQKLPEPPAPEWLEVTRTVINPQIVMARVRGAGPEVAVRVRSFLTWLPGCWMQARRAGAALFIHEGRAPRWRGDRYGFGRPAELSISEGNHEKNAMAGAAALGGAGAVQKNGAADIAAARLEAGAGAAPHEQGRAAGDAPVAEARG